MKNIIHYSGLVTKERNVINLERHLYQKQTENQAKPKIKFANNFQRITEHIKDYLKQDQYKSILRNSFGDKSKHKRLREIIYSHISSKDFLEEYKAYIADYSPDEVADYLVEKIAGLDVLQPLVDIPTVTDINCMDWDNIWVDDIFKGEYKTDISFESETEYLELCNRFAYASSKPYSYSKPSVDAVFPNLRVNFVGQDLSPKVSLSIRIISKKVRLNEELMLETGYANKTMISLLRATFARESHLISGATGTGKTELLRYFTKYTENNGIIIMIEDTPETYLDELYPEKPIRMWKNREATDDDKKEFGYSFHIRNAMRQKPKYIMIQESRGKESLQILKAAESGHVVSTTLHSENAIDSIDRFIDLCEEAQQHDPAYYGKRITKKFGIGIHVDRFGEKNVRKISQIVEYIGYEKNKTITNVLFEYDPITEKHIQKSKMSQKLWNRLQQVHGLLPELKELAPIENNEMQLA
ncbi:MULTISPECIES: ATPase, T2SS/T4P/T4SS family [Bacillus amyloliquefaciens group]|uniref:ATPase, T2SS/T4P/T4SS family n=1 Tax=Bacillus amyloliquefaciens group TaxID=1938374 RepID=UPI002E238CDC|nr:ATPase, T2SS/T4P/T4SS family [Bacillus velezensis]